jgi:act minimal PKS acyl carrier protein
VDELRQIMLTCGVEDGVDLDGDILDVELVDLGYDSLAILHMAAQLEQRTGVPIPDDMALRLSTPRALLAHVNQKVEAA